MLDFFEGILHSSPSEEVEGKFVANVASIHINESECDTELAHEWSLIIRQLPNYDATLKLINISHMYFYDNTIRKSPYLTIYRNTELFSAYSWYMIYQGGTFAKQEATTVTLYLTCLTTDVYVEHMIEHKTSSQLTSALYKWRNTSQSVVLRNIHNVNIILISDRKKIVFANNCTSDTRGIEQIYIQVYKPSYEPILQMQKTKGKQNLHCYGLR